MARDGDENEDIRNQDETTDGVLKTAPNPAVTVFDSTIADCGDDDDVSNERTQRAQMKAEFFRVRSFRGKGNGWPHKELQPALFARTGLYFTGHGDAVLCAFCPCSLSNWKTEDVPADRHRMTSPDCPFLSGENVGNISLALPQFNARPQQTAFVGVASPRFPDLSLYEARLATFETWPASAQQKPENLAEAGFFYMGVDDKVKCFFCEKKLVKWRRSDDPWLEHIKHQPTCHFVLMNKGSEFVQDVLNSYRLRSTQRRHQNQGPSQYVMPAAQAATPSVPVVPPQEDQVTELMHRPPLRRVLSMGYPYDDVKIVVDRLMMERGEQNPTTDLVVNILLQMDDGGFTSRTVPLDLQRPARTPFSTPKQSPVHKPATSASSRVQPRQDVDRAICKICGSAEVELTFLPCGHLTCCAKCGGPMEECPICRQKISERIRTYLT